MKVKRKIKNYKSYSRNLYSLEFLESLNSFFLAFDLDDIETDGLGKRSAFTDDDSVTFLNFEARRAVSRDVGVALLITVVFGLVVEIISTDDDSSFHLSRFNNTSEDSASDRNFRSERTFLIDVSTSNSSLGGLEAKK